MIKFISVNCLVMAVRPRIGQAVICRCCLLDHRQNGGRTGRLTVRSADSISELVSGFFFYGITLVGPTTLRRLTDTFIS